MVRNIAKRIQRLEARVWRSSDRLSMMIHFVDPDMRVTNTLLIESGNRVWTAMEDETTNASGNQGWAR